MAGWWLAGRVAEPGQCEKHDDVSFCFIRHEHEGICGQFPSTGKLRSVGSDLKLFLLTKVLSVGVAKDVTFGITPSRRRLGPFAPVWQSASPPRSHIRQSAAIRCECEDIE